MVPTSGGGASSMTLNPPFMKWTGSPARMAPCHFDVANESSTRTAAMCEPLFTALPAKHWTPSSTPQNGSPRAAHIEAQTSAVMSSWCGSIGATVMPTGSVRASRASE